MKLIGLESVSYDYDSIENINKNYYKRNAKDLFADITKE